MQEDVTKALELIKEAIGGGRKSVDSLNKAVTEGETVASSNLYGYDLQAPAKNIFPVFTPIRNELPRVAGNGAEATHWKRITALTGSGFSGAIGWVPEGQRTDRATWLAENKSATYVTIGEEAAYTFEAQSAAKGFMDADSDARLKCLQALMLKEESAIIGGNSSLTIARPTLTVSADGDDGSLSVTTYYAQVVPLSYEGYRYHKGVPIATGLTQSKTLYGSNGENYTLYSGLGRPSAEGNTGVDAGQSLVLSCAAVPGAVAYAWYAGTAQGQTHLQSITTINSVRLSTVTTSGQLVSALSDADRSFTSGLGFDGFLTVVSTVANGAYCNALATGTAGTGTFLTSGGRGNCEEVDTMLKYAWDNWQLGYDVLYVNAQELKNLSDCVLSSASAPLLRVNESAGQQPFGVVGGAGHIEWYFNPFHASGGIKMPVKIHPNLPAGTMLAWCKSLPTQYQNNNVPNPFEMHVRRDYYSVDFARVSRRFEFGNYCEEVLAPYVPWSVGVITNIGDGVNT